jgi:hypothetical protein
MAWLDWLTGKKAKHSYPLAGHSDVLSSMQMDHSRPMNAARLGASAATNTGQPAATASAQRLEQRRTERNAKRELLFQVVREAMVRIGVLSSAFKFKVLSLDQRGRTFLVMVELSAEFSGEAEKLAEIESLIAHSAKTRYEIIVQAVYWRYFNVSASNTALAQVSTSGSTPLLGALQAPISRPAPLFGLEGRPLPTATVATLAVPAVATSSVASNTFASTMPIPRPASPAPPATPATRTSQPAPAAGSKKGHDELGDDEVAAFRRALAAGASQGAMAAPAPASAASAASRLAATVSPPAVPAAIAKSAVGATAASSALLENARSKLLLTGYEDTEMADDDPMPALSGTQYGDLH